MNCCRILMIVLVVLWPAVACSIPPEAPAAPPLRRIWLTDRNQLPPGDWTSLTRPEFERTWEAAAKTISAATPIDVHALLLRLRVQGDTLLGEGTLDLSHRGATGAAVLRLEPWNVVLTKRPVLAGEPAIVGLPEPGAGLEILVKRPGRQMLVCDVGTRGLPTPAGLQHQIDLPPIPLIEVQVWLPSELRPVSLDARNEFFPLSDRDREGYTGWRCNVGGTSPSRLTFRVQSLARAPTPSPVLAQVKSTYTLTPHGLEGQWQVEATGVRPGTEWLWTLDDDWELIEATDHMLRRPLVWRRLPPPHEGVVAVQVPTESERCSWRVRSRPRSAAPALYRLSGFVPLEAHHCEEMITLRHDRLLTLSSLDPGDFLVSEWNVADTDEPAALRRFVLVARSAGPFPLRRPTFQTMQATGSLAVLQEHWLHLEPTAALLQVRARVQAASGARQLQVRLPHDWQLVDLRWVDSAGGLGPPIHASAHGEVLTLQAASTWTQLEVQAQLRRRLELSEAKTMLLPLPGFEPLGVRDFLANWAVTLARGGPGTEAASLLTAHWAKQSPIWEPPRTVGPWRERAAVPDFSWQTRQLQPAGTLEIRLLPARFTGSVQTTLSQVGEVARLQYRLVAVPQTGEASTISLEFSEPAPAALAWRVAEGSNAIAAYRRLDESHADIVLARPVRGILELHGEAEWPVDQPIPLLRWVFAPTAELWLRHSGQNLPDVLHAGWLESLSPAADGFHRWFYDRSTRQLRMVPQAPRLAAAKVDPQRLTSGLLSWSWRDGSDVTGRYRLPVTGLEQLRFRLPVGQLQTVRTGRTELSWERADDEYVVRVPRHVRDVELSWQVPVRGTLLARAELSQPQWTKALDIVGGREELWTDLPAPLVSDPWQPQVHGGAYVRLPTGTSTTVWAVTWMGLAMLAMTTFMVMALIWWGPWWLGLILAALLLSGGWWSAATWVGLPAAFGATVAAMAGGLLAWRCSGWRMGATLRPSAAMMLLLAVVLPAWGFHASDAFVVYILPGDSGKPESSLVLVPTEEWEKLKRRITPNARSVWVCTAREHATWNGEVLRVSSEVVVHVNEGKGRWPLRLSPGQRLARIMVGGRLREPQLEDGQVWLELAGPGEHECEILWEASAATPLAVSTSLLEAPVHRVNLAGAPEGVAWTLRPTTAVPVATAEGVAWHLPPSHEPWSLVNVKRRGEVRSRAIQEVMLTPEGRSLRSLWNVTCAEGMLAEWSMSWPHGWLVKNVEINAASGRVAPPRLAQWRLEPLSPERSRLVLSFAEPVTGEFRVLVEAQSGTERLGMLLPSVDALGVWGAVFSSAARQFVPQTCALELPMATDGGRDEDLLIVRGDRVTWSVENPGTPVPQPNLLRATGASASRQVFRRGPGDPSPRVHTRPIVQAPVMRQNVQLAQYGVELTMDAELTIEALWPWATRLKITPPAGMKLTAVEGTQVAMWDVGEDRHVVWLAPGGNDASRTSIRLRGWLLLPAPVLAPSEDQLRSWCCVVEPGAVSTQVNWRGTDATVREVSRNISSRQFIGCDGPTWRLASEVHFPTPATGPVHLDLRHWPEGAPLKWEADQPLAVLTEPGEPGQWRVRITSNEPLSWVRLLGFWPVGEGTRLTVPKLDLKDQPVQTKVDLGPGVTWVGPQEQTALPQVRWQSAPAATDASATQAEGQPPVLVNGTAAPARLDRIGGDVPHYLIPCPALLALALRWWRSRLVSPASAS